ncbi:syntaxin binding protein 1 [Coemansia spiralis]|uniref:Syntaxin binding protein 1 n=3 Tax=Coemansia TaxID=4863 RepID=A0A9W8KZ29_9FUNG|nr:syntaxin binding protein 1 [Coemansia spiralis]
MEPSSDANTQQSLFGLLRKSIISAISATVALNKWRVVVVDKPSLKIISSVIKMHEILEQNVMSVQLITRSRQPYPDVEAIYILVPCADSVSRMIDDYKSDLEQPTMERSKYARAHLFFTGALPDSLLSLLSQSPAAPYIKGIGELFVEYNPIESRVFLTTPSEQPFYALYSPHSANMIHRDLDAASDRCLSVLALLGIKPYIRYYRPGQPPSTNSVGYPGIAKTMGELLQQKLDDYYSREKITTENKQEQFDDVSPSVVIVLDRSIDMYAPLVHEFTYQAVVHDLIDLEDGTKYAYEIETKTGETRQVSATLGEQTDLLWHQLKHLHIGHVAQVLADQFSKLIEKSSGVKAASEADKKMTMRQMQDAISELPEFNQLREMYSLHMDLASKCLRIINKNELRVLAEFEQVNIAMFSLLA